jgi:hypothetical protein
VTTAIPSFASTVRLIGDLPSRSSAVKASSLIYAYPELILSGKLPPANGSQPACTCLSRTSEHSLASEYPNGLTSESISYSFD